MTRTALLAACGVALGWITTASALEPDGLAAKFTIKPQATPDGKNVKIQFAVDFATDVEVAIVDGQGQIVRHLAAGLLGKNAPAPLARDSLLQALLWDRTDDLGRPLPPGGNYTVRVGLGLRPKFSNTAFADGADGPDALTNVQGLAAGPDGRVYVMSQRWHSGWWDLRTMHVFTRDGKYERTVKPFSADLPADRLKGANVLRRDDGTLLPVIHRVITACLYPFEDTPQQMAVTPDGHVHTVVIPAKYLGPPYYRLATIDRDGGIPLGDYAGGLLFEHGDLGRVFLAAASDGKRVFVSGVSPENVYRGKGNAPAIYTVDLPGRGPGKLFFGDPAVVGGDKTHLSNPLGIATDGKGNLLIADFGNNRLVVVDERGGRFIGAIDVPAPEWVAVHHKTEAIYVRSGDSIIKFSGRAAGGDPKETARLALPAPTGPRGRKIPWSFALDYTGQPAVLWLGRADGGDDCLLIAVDRGDKFDAPKRAGYAPARRLWNLSAGLDRNTVSCKLGWQSLRILDESTGKTRDLRMQDSGGQTYRFGPNNQIYGMDHGGIGIMRWDKDGKPMPFPAGVAAGPLKGRLPSRPSGTTSWERDFCVDRAGNVYVKERGRYYHGRKDNNHEQLE